MVEYKKGVGINFSELSKEHSVEQTESLQIPEVLSGQEVADLVEDVLDKLPINISSKLVGSNVVLTLAGFKPNTDFFVGVPTDEMLQQVKDDVKKLNELLQANHPNLQIAANSKPFNKPTGDKQRTQMIHVTNLLGWERVSKTSKLPGVTPFDKSKGWQEFRKWYGKTYDAIEEAQNEGKLPKGINVIAGLMHGYPDQAILDFADWDENQHKRELHDPQIPYTGIYNEAEPNYCFYPEHINDPSIQENMRQAGMILKGFYESEWHKKNAEKLSFNKRKEE